MSNASTILKRRYQPKESSLIEERINLKIALAIHDLRTEAGLTQAQLAKKIGTCQSCISRWEQGEYGGRGLRVIYKVVAALGEGIDISINPYDG